MTITALILSETNFADRFVNHYLIVPTCIASTTVQLVAIYLAPEVGFYFICTNFIVLGISSTAKQTVIVWIYVSVGLAILFLITDRPIAMPMSTWTERALTLACFLTALGRCATTGLYGTPVRAALKKAVTRVEEQKSDLITTTEALRVAKDVAVAASRSKSEFLAMMSHEVRTRWLV